MIHKKLQKYYRVPAYPSPRFPQRQLTEPQHMVKSQEIDIGLILVTKVQAVLGFH